ncbi:MAG: dTMP kinase [Chromatocurvus sp.]
MAARGLFITFEGGEGVGKSTALAYLSHQLNAAGVPVETTREPGGTALGEELRDVLLSTRKGPVDPMAELLLMFAARAQHIAERICPALDRGRWVLCDRFTDASYAYQAGGRGLPMNWVQQLENLVQGELHPDCTLLLDAPVATGIERARGRGALDRFESEKTEFFQRVRETYLRLAREGSGRYRLIDASQPLAQVERQLQEIGQELVRCWQEGADA